MGYTEKVKEQQKVGIVSAFYSAYFSRLEKLSGSDLENVIKQIDSPQDKAMSDDEMLSVVKMLAGA